MSRPMLKNPDGECIMCSKDISYKKITALYCDDCKKINLRRSYKESKRRSRNYYSAKICLGCGVEVKRTSKMKRWGGYCDDCKLIQTRESNRESHRNKTKYYDTICKNCKRKVERDENLKYWSGYCENCK